MTKIQEILPDKNEKELEEKIYEKDISASDELSYNSENKAIKEEVNSQLKDKCLNKRIRAKSFLLIFSYNFEPNNNDLKELIKILKTIVENKEIKIEKFLNRKKVYLRIKLPDMISLYKN